MRIRGSVAWITGGSSGIGAALAHELAGRGARVGVTARRAGLLAEVAASAPGEVRAAPADVRDPEALRAAVADVEAQLGPIDLAVLNAGIWRQVDVRRFDAVLIRDHVESNFMGMVSSLDAILPGMLERGAGTIVGIASVAGYRGYTRAEAYGPSKAAEINLLESLRIDLGPLGVDVQIVNPGFVRTPLTDANDFPMPFMIEAPDAARRIADAIAAGKAETVFPLPYRVGMKLLRLVPVRLYTAASRRLAQT